MKRVNHTLNYPGTTVDHVYAMLGDPSFRQAVADYQGVSDFACDITPSGAGRQARLEQAYGTDSFPSFAKRLVGNELRFVQEEEWASSSGADILVSIPGKPGDISGNTTLTQSGDDVVQRIDVAVKVSIPLVGGRLEDMVASFITKAFDAENKVGVKWLRGEWRI
ncbi:MAG: DUF2505 domain-containing protein [Nocardioides sp.]|nr:DUF2505 domain-containing protein [Nocardioides sp.]